ncbi:MULTISPECIES: PCMD domain-containing protein [Bacteroides]|uniref:PCMD domain-containing protein n=1 Tax=Bacteroides TaxID=816 RepID=UPI000B3653D3|nr:MULTISPECIES: DUF4493 domain-containing protein [Bacteroides]MBM6946053.1 PCMD domain-containing protein [Bacteroides gallinaceum]OUO51863.1 hypothetical protein B5F78_12900 [Bacteroides sp. An279]
MKTNKIILAGIMLAAGLLSSCQSELDESVSGYGYLQLSSVEVNKTVDSRADVTDTEDIAVDILNEDGEVAKHVDDWNDLNSSSEGVVLPVGVYTVKAYSFDKDKEAQGFDAEPYYEGVTENVSIVANQAKVVDVACTLAQSLVKVNYLDNFKNAFKTFTCTIEGESNLSIPFSVTETRSAYVKAGQALSVKIVFENDKVFTQQITAKAEAAIRYNVNLDFASGSQGIDIVFDPTIHQYEVTLKVPTQIESTDMVTTNISSDVSKVWGQFAYLSGQCNLTDATAPVQFYYKKEDATEWSTIAATKEGETNNYTAKVAPLDFGTEYEYYIECGGKVGETTSFKTESYEEIPNLDFNVWTSVEKGLFTKRDCWYPNSDQSNSYWATGNEGVVTIKSSNSIPVEGSDAFEGKAAKLSTVDVSLVGYAAGNIFIGNYSTSMTDPASSVTFGRSYTGARPTKLSGYYKYTPGETMRSGATVPSDRTLSSDECDIYVMLWSGDTKIAEAHFVDNKTVSEYTKFELPIEYTDKTKRPDKITIVATSSRYGGEFSGTSVVGQLAVGSTLWVDDFELSYY